MPASAMTTYIQQSFRSILVEGDVKANADKKIHPLKAQLLLFKAWALVPFQISSRVQSEVILITPRIRHVSREPKPSLSNSRLFPTRTPPQSALVSRARNSTISTKNSIPLSSTTIFPYPGILGSPPASTFFSKNGT
jgi:hypothetical protein